MMPMTTGAVTAPPLGVRPLQPPRARWWVHLSLLLVAWPSQEGLGPPLLRPRLLRAGC
eukprot:COSAG01_NODE_422_length_17262_cov_42.635903_18_plen_58_part_00